MAYRPPTCLSCGDPIDYNPKAQATWERVKGENAGPIPGGGWAHLSWPHKMDEHGEDIPGTGKYSMMKTDPDFHYPVVPADAHGPSIALAKQAHMDQLKVHIKRHLSRQFDFLDAEQSGGKHIDLAEG